MKATARVLVLLGLLLALPGAQALSFLEDFEGFFFGSNPDQDWYTYQDPNNIGAVSNEDPALSDDRWMKFEADAGAAPRANFQLAAPTQLTNISFEVAGVTITDDGNGSRQVLAIQSSAPVRTMVEFYVFCTDESNPDACELRVRFDRVDTTGQVLVNTSLAQSRFNITVLPDWTQAEYQLLVDGVDDGSFPFLELPRDVGRLRMGQATPSYPLGLTFDDLFIDGAAQPVAGPERDIAETLREFATDIHFTTPTSLFLLGLIVFIAIVLAVVLASMSLGEDNSIIPPMAFFTVLVALWLVLLEWWPEWIGIALIIVTSALISFVIREKVMGIKDASTDVANVAGSLGYFIIATSLLGFSGYAAPDVSLPTGDVSTPDDQNETGEQQSFTEASVECAANIITLGLLDMDCSRETEGSTWGKIKDFASTVFNFARTAGSFLFQLLTLQLPIPVVFNAMIVFPPAATLAMVGFRFITRSAS